MDPRGQEEEGQSWSIPEREVLVILEERDAGGLQKGQEEGGKTGEIREQRGVTKKVTVPISPCELWVCIYPSFIPIYIE